MARVQPSRSIPAHQLAQLEQRMQSFYATVPDYPSFISPSHHPLEWRHVLAEVRCSNGCRDIPIKILEFGCGRSGFPAWLRDQLAAEGISSSMVSITCQDVTPTNQGWLTQEADHVLISSLAQDVLPPESFSIIFSTHCLEHVARPEQLLTTLQDLLKPGGSLLLFAPRYDLPFYLSPSSFNLTLLQRLPLALRLLLIRWVTRLRGRPAFVIDTNPACLHRPFRRDADAIHWVSVHDLRLFARWNKLEYSLLGIKHRVPPATPPPLMSKQWVIDLFCRLAVRLHKEPLQNP